MEIIIAWVALVLAGLLVVDLVVIIVCAFARRWFHRLARPYEWFSEEGVFEGLFGHSVVALAALAVAAAVYAPLKIDYQYQPVCTDELREDILSMIRVDGTRPILVHIRDGIDNGQKGEPLLLEYIPMEANENKWCATVNYDRRLGFQFKIFVPAAGDPNEMLADLRQKFAPREEYKWDDDGRCRTIKVPPEGRPNGPLQPLLPNDYVTIDKIPYGTWRVWFLLKEYLCISDLSFRISGPSFRRIWNNYFQPSDAPGETLR